MSKLVLGAIFTQAVAFSSFAYSSASADESALAICAKGIKEEIGISRYTTFDKEVGIIKQADGTKHFLINASYKSPKMNEAKSFRSVCHGKGYLATVATVVEGAWSFNTSRSLSQQLADIGF
jgi:hypothetical protein